MAIGTRSLRHLKVLAIASPKRAQSARASGCAWINTLGHLRNEIVFGHRSAMGLGGGLNSTELVATLRICSWPGENRPTARYSMRSSASVLQLLTAQTNC
jgi:hypothetical protein